MPFFPGGSMPMDNFYLPPRQAGPLTALPITITKGGSYQWECPPGIYAIMIQVWGAGAGGGQTTLGAGGGGGGAFSQLNFFPVVPGQLYNFYVGKGGRITNPGEDSWFNTPGTVFAQGGQDETSLDRVGGVGGDAAVGIGDVKFSGGQGGTSSGSPSGGGSGGTGAGLLQNGFVGNANIGNTGGLTVTGPPGGGDGGKGGNNGGNGVNGGSISGGVGGGGGGGGAGGSSGIGQDGKITFSPVWIPLAIPNFFGGNPPESQLTAVVDQWRKPIFPILPPITPDWFPLAQTWQPVIDEAVQPQTPRRSGAGVLFPPITPAGPWMPFSRPWVRENESRDVPVIERRPRVYPTGLFPIPVRRGPGIIPWDEDVMSIRYRRHERLVAEILNTLIWQDMLVSLAGSTWNSGYAAANPVDWRYNPPLTVGAAIDRIAALAKALSGTGA